MSCKYKYNNKWYSEEQVKKLIESEISKDDITLELLKNNSFTVEINTATKKPLAGIGAEITLRGVNYYILPDGTYIKESNNYLEEISKEQFESAKKEFDEKHNFPQPTQYYSKVSVPGDTEGKNKYENNPDWEYLELEIATPDITPSIKGHADFSTNNGIGWIRVWINKKTGVVEIQEIQSDLFQKGRNKEDLIGGHLGQGRFNEETGEFEEDDRWGITQESNEQQNQFLQLLNKDNNWVTFFVKSIIQDSAKKGYKKVLFPTSKTVSGIQKFDKVAKKYSDAIAKSESDRTQEDNFIINEWEKDSTKKSIRGTLDFYNNLKNVLDDYVGGSKNQRKKGIYKIVEITDEYGNKWNEVDVDIQRDTKTIQFQKVIPTEQQLINELKKTEGINYRVDQGGTKRLFTLKNKYKEAQDAVIAIRKKYNLPVEAVTITKANNFGQGGREINYVKIDKKLLIPKNSNQQLKLFQKIKENVDNVLEEKYQREYGISFSEYYNVEESNPSELNDIAKQMISLLEKRFGITVVIDNTIVDNDGNPVSGLVTKDGVVKINPDYLRTDTIAHEFAHLFIDILGYNNPRIQAALEKLRNTDLYKEVQKNYSELNLENFEKEVLATALGRMGSEIFTREFEQNWWDRFVNWFFNLLGLKLKKEKDDLQQLVNEFTNFSTSTPIENKLSDIVSFQKVRLIDDTKLDVILNKFYEDIKLKKKRFELSDTEDSKKFIEEISKLEQTFEENLNINDQKLIIDSVNYISKQYQGLEKRINKMKNNPDKELYSSLILQMNSFKEAFSVISPIAAFINNNKDFFTALSDKEYLELKTIANELTTLGSNIDAQLKNLALGLIASKLTGYDNGFFRKKYELIYQAEFRKAHNKSEYKSNSEFLEAEKKYVNDKIAKNHKNINDETFNYYLNQLKGGSDVWAFSYILDSGQMNSQVIQIVQKILDKADMTTNITFMNDRKGLADLHDEWMKTHSGVNQEKLYEQIQYVGEMNNYLYGEYDPQLYDLYNSLIYKLAKAKKTENVKLINKVKNELRIFKSTNFRKVKGEYVPTAKWKTNLNLSESEKQVLNKLQNILLNYDKRYKVQPHSKNVVTFGEGFDQSIKFYKLPSLNKSKAERMRESGIGNFVKESIKDIYTPRSQDSDEFTEEQINSQNEKHKAVLANEKDEELQRVPVHYRGFIPKNERSSDLFTALTAEAYNSSNFKEKTKIAADLTLLTDVLSQGRKDKTRNDNIFVNMLEKTRIIKNKQGSSTELKMIQSILENRLYGLGQIESIIGPKGNKIASTLNGWSSSVMLGFNYFAAVPNLLMGQATNFSEAHAGKYFTKKDYIDAINIYRKDMGNILGDVNKVNPESKTNLLLDYFEVLSDPSSIHNKFVDNKSFRMLMKKDSLFFLSHSVEHFNQGSLMYSVLNSTKFNGKSILEHITVKDGKLILSEELQKNKDVLIQVRSKIKKVVADSHGQYDPRMKSHFQRTVTGSMVMMFRKWMIRGTVRRFGGVRHIFKDFDPNNLFFSQESGEFEEGNYTTLLRFIVETFKDVKRKGLNFKSRYNSLTDLQKSNMRKTFTEFAVWLSMYVLYSILNNMADDEPDEETQNALYVGAYWFRRTQAEVSFWLNPTEPFKILRSPAASVSFLEKLGKLIYELTPFVGYNEYEKAYAGFEKGDLKLGKRVRDVTPIYGQILRYQEPQDALKYIE